MSYTPPPPPPGDGPEDGPEGVPGDDSEATPPGYGAPPPPGYGTPPPPGYGQVPGAGPGGAPRTNTKAVVALVIGVLSPILGLCCFLFGLAGIAAIVVGRQARTEIAGSGGTQSGEGMAKAGVILGAIGTVIGLLSIVWVVIVFTTGNGSFTFTPTP